MRFRSNWIRLAAKFSAVALLASCGDATDPDAISVQDLYSPGGFRIVDNGDGSIVLSWIGSNYEDDFQGYNVYGAKGSAEDLGVTDGTSIQLLDQEGEPKAAAKSILEKFNYNPDSKFALYGGRTAPWLRLAEAGSTATTPAADKEKKFKFLPIHAVNEDKEPVLPTCQHYTNTSGISACHDVKDEDSRKDEGDVPLNGRTTYSVSGLTPGQSYCFFVFSVQDEGEEISQTSSEVRCIIPRVETDSFNITVGQSARKSWDLDALVDACSSTTCPAFSAHETDRAGEEIKSSSAKAALPLHAEIYGSGDDVYFIAGANAGLRDLGEMQAGFEDAKFDGLAPKFPNSYNETSNPVQAGNGYSSPFNSMIIKAQHMYVVAVADPAVTSPAKFRYHFIYVQDSNDPKKSGTSNTATISLKVRYSIAEE
jgi:hypothetical protein